MKKIKLGAVCIITILFLLSCSNESIFPSLQAESSSVSIEIENNKSRLSNGDILNFTIINKEDTQTNQKFNALLYNSEGELVAEKIIDNLDVLNYAPEIEVPVLENGFYYFEFTVSESDTDLVTLRKEFFVYSDPPGISGISTYPPVVYPGGGGLLSAGVSPKGNQNPYIRWTMGGQIYSQGYYEDGFSQIQWQAPAQDGVYKMAVEIFPDSIPSDFVQPMEGFSYTETQLYVNKNQNADKNEIQVLDGEFSSLFHFRGESHDFVNEGKAAEVLGSPEIALESQMFGYQLENSNGFRLDYSIIPLKEGRHSPFTLFFKGKVGNSETGNNIVSSSNEAGVFKLYLDDERRLSALLSSGSSEFVSTLSDEINQWEITNLAISVIPGSENTAFRWFSNGIQIYQEISESEKLTDSSLTGEWTLISGENGANMFIDELGVFIKDSLGRNAPSPAVFLAAQQETYSDKLIFADGFDGTGFLPGYSSDRTANLANGNLVFEPEEYIILENLPLAGNTSTIDFLWNSSRSGAISFELSSADNSAEITIDYDAKIVRIAGEEIALSGNSILNHEISLAYEENRLILKSEKNEYTLLFAGSEGLSLKISNTGTEELQIEDLIILKESEAIIRNSEKKDLELI